MVRRRVNVGTSPHPPVPPAEARESLLMAVTASIQDAVVSVGADQRITFWNPAAERMLGWSAAEAIGRPLTMIIPERLHDAHLAGIARVAGGAPPKLIGGPPVELVARCRDGTETPIELALGRYVEAGNSFYTGVLRDIRERVRLRRYEAAQERVAAALLTEGDDAAVARAALAALGAGLGWSLGALWLNDAGALVCCATWAAEGIAAEGFTRSSARLRLRAGEGLPGRVAETRGTVWIEDVGASSDFARAAEAVAAGMHAAVGIPLVADDELVGTLEFLLPQVASHDEELARLLEGVSAQLGWVFLRKRSERALAAQARELARRAEELERSNEDLERFAYVASHDLSEPLRTIAGFVQLLRDRHAQGLDPQGLEFLDFAQQGAVRMRAIIDDLLSYSRVGRAELRPERLDLGTLVAEVRAALARQIEEAGASFRIGDLPTVSGDPNQLSQVFQNLVSNAVKFRGPEPPEICVRAEREARRWRILVEDNGIGIDPKQGERVFEMFVRLHRREEYEGTGIGLALCRRILERHGGTVAVEPRDEGGTRVVLTMPASA